jgi:hypothetical protein
VIPADDLVYTPVAPSRIVDTRLAGGSNRFLWNARLQSVDERRRIRVARRRSWFTTWKSAIKSSFSSGVLGIWVKRALCRLRKNAARNQGWETHGGSPRIYAGEGALQRSGKSSCLIARFSAGIEKPGLKPISKSLLLRWTEVQLPLLKQGAPTKAFSTSACVASASNHKMQRITAALSPPLSESLCQEHCTSFA